MTNLPEAEALSLKEARRLSRMGDLDSAEQLFNDTLRSSNESTIHWVFGAEYQNHEEHEKAIVCFNRAIELDEQCVPAWGGLGRSLMDLKRWENSETALRRRLELGESANHYVFLATVLMRQSKYEECIECCEQSLKLDDCQVDALLNLGRAYSFLGRHQEAISACRRSLSIDDQYDDAQVCMGVVLAEANKTAEASDAFQRAIDINPQNVNAYREFGYLQRSNGDPVLARSYLRTARDLEKRKSCGKTGEKK